MVLQEQILQVVHQQDQLSLLFYHFGCNNMARCGGSIPRGEGGRTTAQVSGSVVFVHKQKNRRFRMFTQVDSVHLPIRED